ncbi:MAG: hypothetical protein P4L84_24645 [Isosphaeraceae bacterium]|nr:hypothetical protein [Isosphaeraceae bacterium]
MSRRHLRRAAGLAGLLVLTFAGGTVAQNTNTAQGNAGRDAHGARMLVHHALDMAIEGSTLQLTSRELVANDAAGADRKGSDVSERVRDLQRDARQNFEGTNKMLADAYAIVRDDQANAMSRRYYDAAARYTKTLYGVIGEPLAKSEDFGAGTDKDKGKALTAADVATVILVNHAVKEAIDAYHLRKMTAHAADGTATERLREHAKQMAAHSQRCIDKLSGSAGAKDRDDVPSVARLARQARDLVQMVEDDRDDNTPGEGRR